MICRRIALSLAALAALCPLAAQAKPPTLSVRTTAYTHTEADHLKYGKKSAAGTKLRLGRDYTSAAADWSKFPLGTEFRIQGMDTTFVIDDYGSALVGTETIDIYHPTKSAMNRWGVRHVDIEILKHGDVEKSREILASRSKHPHVRAMLTAINSSPPPDRTRVHGFPFFRKPAPSTGTQLPAPAPEKPSAAEPAVLQAKNDSPPRSKTEAQPPATPQDQPSSLPPPAPESPDAQPAVAQTLATVLGPLPEVTERAPSASLANPVPLEPDPAMEDAPSAIVAMARAVEAIDQPAAAPPRPLPPPQARKRQFRPLALDFNG